MNAASSYFGPEAKASNRVEKGIKIRVGAPEK